jgi:hypothetical protein
MEKMIMKLITEDRFDVKLSEPEGTGNLFIEGIFSSADIMNDNGRKYKRPTLEREIGKFMQQVENKCAWGELGHPASPQINPDRIAILVESLNWDSDNVFGRAKVIDTPAGNIAKTLIKEGKVGISSRGLGTVNEVDSYVNDDFNLICYDVVLGPSNPPSWMKGIYEGAEFNVPIVEKIVDPEIRIKEAKNAYYKHIWQVLEDIERGV